ncbi:MAG: acyltransferase family protein [Hyphomonadaceae bacterium]|nr:acyltransferase family protein [Hyphomonadaceae bacterium]
MATSIIAPSGRPRRYDLDWLRVIALVLLIVYHVLCVFDSGGWVLKSDHAGVWADGVVDLLTPWRMMLVFVVGGAACRFLFEKFDLAGFTLNRTLRLLVPFVLGVALLTPPQAYIHLLAQNQYEGSFLHFWATGFWTSREVHGIQFPDFAHLWFLPYLFIYAIGAAIAWTLMPRFCEGLVARFDRLPLALTVLGVMAWLLLIEVEVDPRSHRTMAFFWDWNGHMRFGPAFLLGLLAAHADQFWRRLVAARWMLWSGAVALAALTIAEWAVTQDAADSPALRAIYGATALFAFLALGAALLNKPSPVLTYWNDAVLPIYVLHQTVLVIFVAATGATHWPVIIAFLVLLAATLGVSEGIYHWGIRRNRWLRMAFGQSPAPRPCSPAPQAPPLSGAV